MPACGVFPGRATKYFLILLSLALHFNRAGAQLIDYRKIFGSDWDKALEFVKDNDVWIRPSLEKYNIPYAEAIAVVFPEIVRYSAIRDKMETGILKALYVNLGKDYANFSIGHFQIKPSFAEMIRDEAPLAMGKKARELFGKKLQDEDAREMRSLIVKELEDPRTEFNYVIAFYLICIKKFRDLPAQDSRKIIFLASAYNTGFWKEKDEIITMAEKKFYNTRLFSKDNYSYSEVSLFWYNEYQESVR